MNHATALLAATEIGDPLVRGSLALFPLFHELAPSRRYVSGPRAAAAIEVHELSDGAVVPELEVANPTAQAVLLIDGETLLGGLQNRIVTTSVFVAAGERTTVSVTCVEAGRWSDERPVGHSDRHAPSAVRARNRRSVTQSAFDGTELVADQAGVWEEVDRYAAAVGADSATQAMEDVHAHAADRVAALVGGTKPLAGQCGVAATIGRRVVAIDLFDDPATLADYWDALVAGYALDASPEPTKRLRRRDVRRVLGAVAAARATETADRIHVEGDGIAATALRLDDVVVHLAVSATA
jgi:hypothetical protein